MWHNRMNLQQPHQRAIAADARQARFIALAGLPMVKRGDDLAVAILASLAVSHEKLCDGDVLILAQKIVSKAEGRTVRLDSVEPSAAAQELAREVNKDARLVELILRESTEVVRWRRDVLIVAHRLGFVTANAGIDISNVEQNGSDETALLLPEDPDTSCAQLRASLKTLTGADVAVVINDSHGRAFRNGTIGVAIGAAGLPALTNWRGEHDLFGRPLQHTEVALADEVAAAASLLMGQAGEGKPVVLARGVPMQRRNGSASELVRAKRLDLFRVPTADALLRGRRSIRRYRPQAVSDETLTTLLETATYAPSAHNRQPWRFAVVNDQVVKRSLAHAMGERLRADRTRDGDDPSVVEKDVARSFARLDTAPAIVVVCLTMEDMDLYRDARRAAAEHQMAVQSTAMAIQNLLLAVHAAELGANVMCAPLFCPDTVRIALAIPDSWEPQALVSVGYPEGTGKPARRRPLTEVVHFIRAKT
jgi:coenzyme F420-0:L-glutamate ligase/coenzyme F420-1:gamma-L-glutamate ligase